MSIQLVSRCSVRHLSRRVSHAARVQISGHAEPQYLASHPSLSTVELLNPQSRLYSNNPSPQKKSSEPLARQWSTPLAKSLAEAITTTGPVSIAKFMRLCLTSPDGGYYTQLNADGHDQFGKKGDFVTSPEISQIFGELVGIWFVAEWMAQGRRTEGVHVIELGPGRGTLLADILRTISTFRPMASAIEAVYLVEASPVLREIQKNLLCGENVELEQTTKGWQASSKHIKGAKIVWLEDMSFLPPAADPACSSPFIVAHEFFDALPIHAFQAVAPTPGSGTNAASSEASDAIPSSRSPGSIASARSGGARATGAIQNRWHELLVSPTAPPSVLNPPKEPGPEFELTVSATPAPHSQLLPNISSRYRALLPTAGSTIEISPESLTTVQQLARLIGESDQPAGPPSPGKGPGAGPGRGAGAALIIDYGPSATVPISTLRGIRAHGRCSPFMAAGTVDISVDVDFGALAEMALRASQNVEVHGPVEQADWLAAMGGQERCDALRRKAGDGAGEEGAAERIETGWKRLVDRGSSGMGRVYKAMAIIPASNPPGRRRPVGFGGDVAS